MSFSSASESTIPVGVWRDAASPATLLDLPRTGFSAACLEHDALGRPLVLMGTLPALFWLRGDHRRV